MRAIHRKLLRELWQLRWQAFAIVLVMASGVAVVIMSLSTLQSLEESRSRFYDHCRFGHAFVHLKRAPSSIVSRIRGIAGVQAVEARVVQSVLIDVPGLTEPATGRLISYPDHADPVVSRLHLRSGRFLQPDRNGEVLVAEAFATAHRMQPGDQVVAIMNGKQQTLRIVGIVLSPEYVYSVRPGELLPDDKRFGVLWMGYDELAAAFDLKGAFNDVTVTIHPDASEAAVLANLDELLSSYGGTNAYNRALQPSHRFLENELIQLRTMALVPPILFLSVTAFLLHVVMSRLVALQREQIAMMRAFGYTRGEIFRHFLLFALIISFVGAATGVAAGAELGSDLTFMYARFFRFPEFDYRLDWRLVLMTSAISFLAAIGGVWSAVWHAASRPPAQAMQPEAPTMYRASILERLGLQHLFPQFARMILRQLERRPMRAALSSLGISLSIGILVMGNFLEDTVDHVLDFQFFVVQRYDVMVAFVEPSSSQAIRDLDHLPGVIAVEPFRAVPVRLVNRNHQRRLEVLGLEPDSRLMRVVDAQTGPVSLPDNGLAISRRLAEVLECKLGDTLRLETLEGIRASQEVQVVRVLNDYLDLNAYMHLSQICRLLREQDTVSGAFLSVDGYHAESLYARLKRLPRISGVGIKRAAIESYNKTMRENLLRMKTLNVFFAAIVAIGVVYNCARISLAERTRDLATLRVLGFTRREISQILLGELAVLVVAAIPLGLAIGYILSWLLTAALNTEVHRFPLIIHRQTYVFAVLVTIVAAIGSALVVNRRLNRLQLVEVLKARD